MTLQLFINQSANKAIKIVAKRLELDPKKVKTVSIYNPFSKLVEIEVIVNNQITSFRANPKTSEFQEIGTTDATELVNGN